MHTLITMFIRPYHDRAMISRPMISGNWILRDAWPPRRSISSIPLVYKFYTRHMCAMRRPMNTVPIHVANEIVRTIGIAEDDRTVYPIGYLVPGIDKMLTFEQMCDLFPSVSDVSIEHTPYDNTFRSRGGIQIVFPEPVVYARVTTRVSLRRERCFKSCWRPLGDWMDKSMCDPVQGILDEVMAWCAPHTVII